MPLEGGRRPDVVVLAGEAVLVIEFKTHPLPTTADVDQVLGYARDLTDYHAACRDRRVVPMLLLQEAASGFARQYQDVWLLSPEALARYLHEEAAEGRIDLDGWLDSPYSPLPTLVEAARRIFLHEPLPHLYTAIAEGIPETVDLLGRLAERASVDGQRVLAFVTGVPGAGKTLVGLRLVYERSGVDGKATFLSGNGPLVAVLQDALKSRVFVRDLHAFIKTYGLSDRRKPDAHVIVFDEAQRAWDADYMAEKRHVDASEPTLLIRAGERIDDWATLVGLVGEGQEIHSGEEGGLDEATSFLAAHDLAQALQGFVRTAMVRRGLHRVRKDAPDVGARHVVAIAFSQPAAGENSDLEREGGFLLGEVASGAGERLRVARAGARESHGLIVETCLLGGGEPLRIAARRGADEIGEQLTRALLRVLLADGPERREVRPTAIRPQAVALVGLLDESGGEEASAFTAHRL